MLQSFMIIAPSGLVLYRKVLFHGTQNQHRMVGGLLAALTEYTQQHTGLPFSHVEMEKLAVSVVETPVRIKDSPERLICALFHDVDDGEIFGRLEAGELLHTFVDEYSERLANMRLSAVEDIEDIFVGLSALLGGAFERSVQTALYHLEKSTQARHVLLIRRSHPMNEDFIRALWHSSGTDAISDSKVAADLQGLLNLSVDLSEKRREPSLVVVGDRIRIERMSRGTLLVAYNTPTMYLESVKQLEFALDLIRKVFKLLDHMQGSPDSNAVADL